jgi:hypothetical protein
MQADIDAWMFRSLADGPVGAIQAESRRHAPFGYVHQLIFAHRDDVEPVAADDPRVCFIWAAQRGGTLRRQPWC